LIEFKVKQTKIEFRKINNKQCKRIQRNCYKAMPHNGESRSNAARDTKPIARDQRRSSAFEQVF